MSYRNGLEAAARICTYVRDGQRQNVDTVEDAIAQCIHEIATEEMAQYDVAYQVEYALGLNRAASFLMDIKRKVMNDKEGWAEFTPHEVLCALPDMIAEKFR